MYVQRKIEARFCKYFCSGRAIGIKHSECVFVALGIQHAIRMRHIVICGLPGSTSFPHYLINGTTSEKKVIEYKICF